MTQIWLACIGLAAMLPVLILLFRGTLRLQADYFFLLYWAQVVSYIHIFPILALPQVAPALRGEYIVLAAEVALLFELPLLLIYLAVRPRRNQPSERGRLRVRAGAVLALGGVELALGLMYLILTALAGMLFTHTSTLLEEGGLLRLPTWEYLAVRFFALSAPGLVLVLLAATLLQPQGWRRRLSGFFCTGIALVYLSQQVLNSRIDVLMLLLLAVGVISQIRPIRNLSPARLAGFAALAGMAFWGYHTAIAAREMFSTSGTIGWSVLDPFRRASLGNNPIIATDMRLNGLDLMARIAPVAAQEGFAMGRAWRIPALVVWNNVTFHRSANNAYHETMMDNAKRYLMTRYTTVWLDDYPSCSLVDLYGNFGLWGFLFGGLAAGGLFAGITRSLEQRRSAVAFVAVLLLLRTWILFETDWFIAMTGWIPLLPFVAALVFLNPFRRERFDGAQDARRSNAGFARRTPGWSTHHA